MIHWQTVKEFFGFSKKQKEIPSVIVAAEPTAPRPATPSRPPIKKTSIRTKNYYRRNGKFYSSADDGLIDDIMLLVVLDELFNDGDIREYNETEVGSTAPVDEDLLNVDVSDTPVVEAPKVDIWKDDEPKQEQSWNSPEPVKQDSYSSGSSYASGSSDYDSGDSDSGSSDD